MRLKSLPNKRNTMLASRMHHLSRDLAHNVVTLCGGSGPIVGADLSGTSPIHRPSSHSLVVNSVYTTYPEPNALDFQQYTRERSSSV